MTFEQIIEDVKKLIGLELHSVRPGSNITILEVDEERNNLVLLTSQGTKRSRPLSELKIIWDEMVLRPAVHVDEVLHGSGTSRNQPETILANLPYVEWLKITNKKHIAYIDKDSHPFGTIKQMDPISAANIIERVNGTGSKDVSMVIVSDEIASDLARVRSVGLGKEETVEQGVYLYKTEHEVIVFLSSQKTELESGTYCVITGNAPIDNERRIAILGKYYSALCEGRIKALIKES